MRIPAPESASDKRQEYNNALLQLALSKTQKLEGPFRIESSQFNMMAQGRGIEWLKRGEKIDLVIGMTSIERELDLLPIRIPLLKGLLGYRIFIIRKEDQARFAEIRSLDDLRKLKAGQAHTWPDVDILRANGIEVVVGRSYGGLFEMLQRRRFDYIPRGVTEAWAEVESHAHQGLVVEENLMLVYPTDMYYFVNRGNTGLARRIERGLRLAIADGSFDQLFNEYHGLSLKRARMDERRVFRLVNPVLPPETPLNEASLWYRLPD